MLKVMIAEDDLFMADMLADFLAENGYEVCGIAATVDEAVELDLRHKPDLAILDMRLANGGRGSDIVSRIHRRAGLGVLYASGNVGRTGLTSENGDGCLSKPYRPDDLIRALGIIQQIVLTGQASRPFPKGFTLLEKPDPA